MFVKRIGLSLDNLVCYKKFFDIRVKALYNSIASFMGVSITVQYVIIGRQHFHAWSVALGT